MLNDIDTLIDEAPVPEWRNYHVMPRTGKVTQIPKTDEEIEEAANLEWLDILTGMWEAIGKPIDEKRLQKYEKELRGIPLGLLERAVSRAIRDSHGEYLVVPPIAAIWKALRKELGNPYDLDEAIARWSESLWQSAVYRFK